MDYFHEMPDDIVGLILLRLDSQVCLLRAASTCRRWRPIITGAVFLRRFRSLHEQPPVAGSYYNCTHFVIDRTPTLRALVVLPYHRQPLLLPRLPPRVHGLPLDNQGQPGKPSPLASFWFLGCKFIMHGRLRALDTKLRVKQRRRQSYLESS
ncbi:hypothetical protein EJB05_42632, partial [Eragrostis curvula]